MNYDSSEYRFTSVWDWKLSGCRHTLFVAFLFILAGCYASPPEIYATPPPLSCAAFTESRWQEFGFGVDSPDDVVSTVVRLWDIDKDEVLLEKLSNSQFDTIWRDGNARLGYSAYFRANRQLTKVTATWGNPQPAFGQVLDCLGPPEYYQAFYRQEPEARSLNLGLWYLEKGFVVGGNSIHYLAPPPEALMPGFRMDYFIVIAPGTPEQMVPNVYTVGDDPRVREHGLCRLRPWPGSIDTMEIEEWSAPCNWQFGPDGETG